jgi:hypothetical protein
MKIRIVKKLFKNTWYKIGQGFDVVREDKARFAGNLLIPVYVIKHQGIEKIILKQDCGIVEEVETNAG